MSVDAGFAPALSGPSASRIAFLRSVGFHTFMGLSIAAATAIASMLYLAPAMMGGGFFVVLGAFFFSHFACRRMVYGNFKLPGFILASVGEGIAFGFLLLSTVLRLGAENAFSVVTQAMLLTAGTGGGFLLYTWFNKSDLSLVRAGLSILGLPLLFLMAFTWFFPVGGIVGLILCAVFVVASGAALLYQLHQVAHAEQEQVVEASYEITMASLVLLCNLISLLICLRS